MVQSVPGGRRLFYKYFTAILHAFYAYFTRISRVIRGAWLVFGWDPGGIGGAAASKIVKITSGHVRPQSKIVI